MKKFHKHDNCLCVQFLLTWAPQKAVCGPPRYMFTKNIGSLKMIINPAKLRLVTIMLAGVCKLRNLQMIKKNIQYMCIFAY